MLGLHIAYATPVYIIGLHIIKICLYDIINLIAPEIINLYNTEYWNITFFIGSKLLGSKFIGSIPRREWKLKL